jgi:predicted nucleic acid-binding protein
MTVVSNASPLINLARIGQLELLPTLYDKICIPEAVWQEVVVAGQGLPGAEVVATAAWITRYTVTNSTLVAALRQDLDAGEAEAIALALELQAELLLMDETLGRETARHLGQRFIGIIGVLIEAHHKGLINALKPYLDALRNQAGFRVRDALYTRVLRDAGEM